MLITIPCIPCNVHDIHADKKTDCAFGKPVGGSSLEEVELRGGKEVPHVSAPCPGRYRPDLLSDQVRTLPGLVTSAVTHALDTLET